MTLDAVRPHHRSTSMQDDQVVTAGAFLLYEGLFAFAVGPTPAGDGLAVFRLGGHREPGETAAQCAVREVWEEAAVPCTLVEPPATYLMTSSTGGGHDLRPLNTRGEDSPAPLLVAPRSAGRSVTYLAVTEQLPAPSAEVAGILLLDVPAIRRLTQAPVTLGEYCASGGRAVLRRPLDPALPLKPLAQLQILPLLLALHPNLTSRA